MKNSDLRSVIRESLGVAQEPLQEALVAAPKSFDQNTELLSKKLKEAHYELYKQYVQSFNEVSAKLDTADRKDVSCNSSAFRSLKLDESHNMNAVYLHELYFANVSDVHSEIFADSLPYIRLQRDFGTFDDWQRDFIACAMSAREGWAVCGYNLYLKRFVNTFVDLHGQGAMLGLMPVIVVDMWTHSYHRDYLIDKKTYLLGQMHELNWRVIEDRFKRADRVAEAQK
jgi:Fe-Mn family superoxide dismutase